MTAQRINDSTTEHRAAARHRVLKAGTIAFGGGGGISCVVRNLSAGGAALDVVSPLGIPNAFKLIVEQDHSSRECRVVWRTERRIGVIFEPPGVPDYASRLRRKAWRHGTWRRATRCPPILQQRGQLT